MQKQPKSSFITNAILFIPQLVISSIFGVIGSLLCGISITFLSMLNFFPVLFRGIAEALEHTKKYFPKLELTADSITYMLVFPFQFTSILALPLSQLMMFAVVIAGAFLVGLGAAVVSYKGGIVQGSKDAFQFIIDVVTKYKEGSKDYLYGRGSVMSFD